MSEQLSVTPVAARTPKKKPAARPQVAPVSMAPTDTTQAGGPDWTKLLEMGVPATMLIAGLISGSRAKGKKRGAVGRSMQGFGQALMQLTAMKEQSRQTTAAGLARTETAEAGAKAAAETAMAKTEADARKAEIDADKEARRRWEKNMDIAWKYLSKFPEDPIGQRMYMELIGSEPRAPKKTQDFGPRANLLLAERRGEVDEGTFEATYGSADKLAPSTQEERYLRSKHKVDPKMPIEEAAQENEELAKDMNRLLAIKQVMPWLALGMRTGSGVFGGDPTGMEEFGVDIVKSLWGPALDRDVQSPFAYTEVTQELRLSTSKELKQWGPQTLGDDLLRQGTTRDEIDSHLREQGYNPFSVEWRTHIAPALNAYERRFREAAKKKR